jgi:hypothetical protein
MRIAVIRMLHVKLGCGVREAVALAEVVLESRDGDVHLGPWLTLSIERAAVERELHGRLAEVLESAPRPRRGRPPGRRSVSPPDGRS